MITYSMIFKNETLLYTHNIRCQKSNNKQTKIDKDADRMYQFTVRYKLWILAWWSCSIGPANWLYLPIDHYLWALWALNVISTYRFHFICCCPFYYKDKMWNFCQCYTQCLHCHEHIVSKSFVLFYTRWSEIRSLTLDGEWAALHAARTIYSRILLPNVVKISLPVLCFHKSGVKSMWEG